MRKIISLMVLATFTLSLLPVNVLIAEGSGHVSNSHTLYAGQDNAVGEVHVSNDEDFIYVEYELDQNAIDEGWCITETHVHVWDEDDAEPTNRSGNPAPGQFDYKENHDPCVTEHEYTIDNDWEKGDELNIAAHAVVEKEECEILATAPYGGSIVVDTHQAWRIDHTPEAPSYVRAQRSDSKNALEIGVPGQETFYSLGYGGVLNDNQSAVETFFGENFEDRRNPDAISEMGDLIDEDLATKLSDTENNAGWIIIEFDKPVLNVEGEHDLQVVEDTWGLPYPLEMAAVFGRADAEDDWTFLFLAHNQKPLNGNHTYTNGILGDLDSAIQILVQDVSDPEWFIPYPHSVATLDGYDLNAVVGLNDHEVCKVYDESAWADGERFTEKGNWATYFKYTVMEEEPEICSIEKYTLDIASVNGNTGFTHEFVLYYNLNLNYIYGTGDSHAGTQTLSHFDHETTADGILEYIKFRSDYDATTYFWFPAFNLLENGELKYVNIGGDNVNDATGSWKSECAYNLLETVEVDSKEIDGIQSVNELNKDEIYKFVASGTWKNGNVHTAVDAEYRLPVSATEWESSVGRSLRLQVNEGYFNWSDGVFNPNHIYKAYFTGDGSTVNFRINDGNPPEESWYGDNEGSLTVEIYEVW